MAAAKVKAAAAAKVSGSATGTQRARSTSYVTSLRPDQAAAVMHRRLHTSASIA